MENKCEKQENLNQSLSEETSRALEIARNNLQLLKKSKCTKKLSELDEIETLSERVSSYTTFQQKAFARAIFLNKFWKNKPYNVYHGVITSVHNPSQIYVQFFDKDLQDFNRLKIKLQQEFHGNKSKPPLKLKKGYTYAVLFEGVWHRAVLVRDGKSDEVAMQFLDTGRCVLVDYFNIRHLPRRFIRLPAQAVRCELSAIGHPKNVQKKRTSSIRHKHWPVDIMNFIKSQTNKKVIVNVHEKYWCGKNKFGKPVKNEIGLLVDIRVESDGNSINYQINDIYTTCGEKWSENGRENNRIVPRSRKSGKTKKYLASENNFSSIGGKKNYFYEVEEVLDQAEEVSSLSGSQLSSFKRWIFLEANELTRNFRGALTWLDEKGGFYIQYEKWYNEITTISEKLDIHNRTIPFSSDHDTLKVGEACLAKYAGIWFRAIIKALNPKEKNVMVFLIDYGASKYVQQSDIRMDIILQDIPSRAFRCYLHNLQPLDGCKNRNYWPNELIDFINREIINQEFNVIVKSYSPLIISLHYPGTSESLTDFLVSARKGAYITEV